MEQTMITTEERRATEVADRARSIYAKTIRRRIESDHTGEMLVIDVETGDYEIDPDEDAAWERIESRRPDGVFYVMRIGYPAAYFVGVQQ